MTSAAYQYLSDDGNVYQTLLDSDFAGVLGYVLASGSEPYLPAFISMRYATYKTITGVILNAVYITNPFNSLNPPAFFALEGVSYFYLSSYGEQRGFSQNPTIVTIAGPPGPPGPGGGGGVTSITAGSGIAVSGSTGAVTVTNTGVLTLVPAFTSANQSFNFGGASTIAHGLGREPNFVDLLLVCVTANNGYTVGQFVALNGATFQATDSSGHMLFPIAAIAFDATNLYLTYAPSGADYQLFPRAGGAPVTLTNSQWRLVARAW